MNEIRRLYDRMLLAPARTARIWLAMHWHRWRTRHQVRARASHYRARAARAHSP
ncbi:hypothetical protein [Streptomyces sp. NBC_01455]|uniref:hypothetical protein n=1 Tax=Streptomyces sp. NBC_01455 TaxID=2903874 RepID=UPI002E3224F4|nr:hypothetical protein [Streptomyces sp. NBC_01455]